MQAAVNDLEFTGERMMPELSEKDCFWEHIYRYRFACGSVKGKRVLDVACGEGYGSAAMVAAGAASVIGIDYDDQAVEHGKTKYGIDARQGNAEDLPIPDASVDLLVSFETIEHVPHPEKFLDECQRVLAPGGTLIMSSPNRDIYRSAKHQENPFHCSEMSIEEFKTKLGERFTIEHLYSQKPAFARGFPRALAADSSLVFQFKLARGVRKVFRLAACPSVAKNPSAEERKDPASIILRHDAGETSIFNPFTLRPLNLRGNESPAYVVAVAKKA